MSRSLRNESISDMNTLLSYYYGMYNEWLHFWWHTRAMCAKALTNHILPILYM